jgi:hypothetical protein
MCRCLVTRILLALPPRELQWSGGPCHCLRSAMEELSRVGVEGVVVAVVCVGLWEKGGSRHGKSESYPTSCWWAELYRTDVSNKPNIPVKSIWIIFLESAGELRIIILRKERSKVDQITTPRPNPQASPTRGSLTGPTRPYLKRQ